MHLIKIRIKIPLTVLITVALLYFFTKGLYATEGTIELKSTTNEPTKCYAVSLRMQSQEYNILFSCRYLIYPVDSSIFNYVMWANPTDGGKTFKLGTLNLGKGQFKTKTPFNSLYVTTESNQNTRTPTGNVVMQGSVQPIGFLEEPTSPVVTETITPTPGGEAQPAEEQQELSTKDKLVLALKRAGIAALFALVALIGIIFVVSRARG